MHFTQISLYHFKTRSTDLPECFLLLIGSITSDENVMPNNIMIFFSVVADAIATVVVVVVATPKGQTVAF